MDIEYRGANCVQITTKGGTVVTDPNLKELGLKDVSPAKVDVYLLTQGMEINAGEAFVIDSAGEYEVKGFGIRGMMTRSHMGDENNKNTIIYRVVNGDTKIAVTGHMFADITDEQLETLGIIDILVIPVGGFGYTMDAIGAAKIVRKIDPKVVIPTHYADDGTTYPVDQADIDDFIKELGAPVVEEDKLKIKAGSLPESLTVVKLKRA